MNKICVKLPCGKDEESHNNNGYESAASFSLGHNPNGGATKHLLQRRVGFKRWLCFLKNVFEKSVFSDYSNDTHIQLQTSNCSLSYEDFLYVN